MAEKDVTVVYLRQVEKVVYLEQTAKTLEMQTTKFVKAPVLCFECGETTHPTAYCFLYALPKKFSSMFHFLFSSCRYKRKLCWWFRDDKKCPYDVKCHFAHGTKEQRSPWITKCVEVIVIWYATHSIISILGATMRTMSVVSRS
jgi:hypothetical protein